jgi:(p)ppGpp synthase/HD superfamily hydrolase
MQLSSQFNTAILYAIELHINQTRKGSGVPYISHLLAVCALVMEHGGDEDQAIAALLHDAAEDQGGEQTLTDIRTQFGERAAQMVADLSDTLETPKPPWRVRKETYLAHLPHTSTDSLLISLADKVHNARSILADHAQVGEKIWERFKQGRGETLWYYRSLADIFQKIYPGYLASELDRVVSEMEQLDAATDHPHSDGNSSQYGTTPGSR